MVIFGYFIQFFNCCCLKVECKVSDCLLRLTTIIIFFWQFEQTVLKAGHARVWTLMSLACKLALFLIAVVVLRVLPCEIVTRSVNVSSLHRTVLSAVVYSQGLKNVFQILRTLC